MESLDIQPVLLGYPPAYRTAKAEFLCGAGGFSGARLWRLRTEHGQFALRRWPPEHPSPERLAWIHQVLEHIQAEGVNFLAVPIPTSAGATWAKHAGHLWELSPWLPGVADYFPLRLPDKLRAALTALAQLHNAAATFGPRRVDTSPGLQHRLEQLRSLRQGEATTLGGAVERAPASELRQLGLHILTQFQQTAAAVEPSLTIAAQQRVPLQPCLRDIWHDHVLFAGTQVTGLIDYGAMNVETVASDIARLLGSLAGNDTATWQQGLEAYQTVRPLTAAEHGLIPVFDRSSVLLSGMHWIEWIYQQGRSFDDPTAVLQRIRNIVARL